MRTVPLVGRELDLAAALEQLKRIERGASASLLVRGEAGVGKSRLVGELLARARRIGYVAMIGRSDDLDRGIPYAAFRDLLARLSSGGLEDDLTPFVERFRRLLDGEPAPGGDEDGPLTQLFASAVTLFRELSAAAPTVVVLEDLHIADRESLALAALLARLSDAPMLTVVTMRPEHPAGADVERLLERMAYDGRGAVIDLEPLDRHEIQALVAAALSAAPDDGLADAVFEASKGNPFFALEVVQAYADGQAIVVSAGRAHLRTPAQPVTGLRSSTVLLRRLFAGTPADIDLAKAIAVFGRFSLRYLPLVERLVGQSSTEVALSFDRLVKSGVMEPSTEGGYEFTHAIVRNTLYEDIGPAERRRIHAAIAAELVSDRRAGFPLDISQLAVHVAASAEPGDVSAADVLNEAGRAMAATAPLVAAEHHRRAVELLPVGSAAYADALAKQARSLHIGCRPAESALVGGRALRLLEAGAVRQATAAIVASDLLACGDVPQALRVVEDELRHGGEPCPLLALRTHLLFQAGHFAEARAALPDALGALGALGSSEAPPAAQLTALTQLIQYANHVGRAELAAELLGRLEGLEGKGSATVQLTLHEQLAFVDWRPGIVDRIEHHLATARRLRRDSIGLSIGGGYETDLVRLHWMRGEWDEALELVRSAGFALEQRGVVTGAQLVFLGASEILVDRGSLDEATAMVGRLVGSFEVMRRARALQTARLRRAVDDRGGAVELLEEERRRWAAGGCTWKLGQVLGELAENLLADDRTAQASEVVAELEAMASATGWPECTLPAARARAVLGHDIDAARAYLELAEQERWEVERAHALLVLGELDENAAPSLVEAYKLFDAFGAAPLRRRAAAALRARGRAVPRRPAKASSALTETDAQLIRLVRQGLSNQQIATALHFSPKTIEVYLSRIYVKTGCRSRLQLIRAVDTGAIELGS